MTDDLARAADAWATLPEEARAGVIRRLELDNEALFMPSQALGSAIALLRAAVDRPRAVPTVTKPYPVGTYLRDERDGEVVCVDGDPDEFGAFPVKIVSQARNTCRPSPTRRYLKEHGWFVVGSPR